MRARLPAVALVALLAAPAGAEARTYDVPAALGGELRRVASRTPVPVRVPASLRLDFDRRLYASGSASRRRWTLRLAGTRGCRGATACTLATMSGERGGRQTLRRPVRLARGITGGFRPQTCAASCSPPMVQWLQRGVLFTIQAKIGATGDAAHRAALVRSANQAIRRRAR